MKSKRCLVCGKNIGEGDCFSMAFVDRRPGTQIVEHDIYFHRECLLEEVSISLRKKIEVIPKT